MPRRSSIRIAIARHRCFCSRRFACSPARYKSKRQRTPTPCAPRRALRMAPSGPAAAPSFSAFPMPSRRWASCAGARQCPKSVGRESATLLRSAGPAPSLCSAAHGTGTTPKTTAKTASISTSSRPRGRPPGLSRSSSGFTAEPTSADRDSAGSTPKARCPSMASCWSPSTIVSASWAFLLIPSSPASRRVALRATTDSSIRSWPCSGSTATSPGSEATPTTSLSPASPRVPWTSVC